MTQFVSTDAIKHVVYHQLVRRKVLTLSGMALLLVVCLLLDVSLGPARLPFVEVVQAVFAPGSVSTATRVIVWEIRLPIALMAVAVGTGLAIAGAEMQTILNNPLASPFTLGISAAASFGAALAIVLGISVVPFVGGALVPVNAFLFSMLASMLIYVASRLRGVTIETVILLGIALVFTFNALLALLQYIATEQALQEVVFWTLGSLTKATWSKVGIAFATIAIVTPFLVRSAWALTALRLGDEKARSLGVNVRALRLRVLVLVSLLASIAVAFVGTIGFVGLVGPHVARMIVGEDQRFFLPVAALAGAIMMSATSIISKEVIPGVIFPIGIVTALVGVPFFLSLVLARRRDSWN
ncbi:MAG: iron ABC transporter permease [Alphaproteobacteria bacterium]|nr:iron ABC transporter permease [Alphaproteobacteria bacterium]